MNIFNRIILVLLLLGLIFVLTACLIFPDQILSAVGQFLVDWGQYFALINQQQPYLRLAISIAIAVIIDLILALLIFWEVKPKRKRFIKVEQVSGGKATVSLDSIVRQLLYRLDPLPGVVKVIPMVNPKGDKIQARLDVTVTREKALPQMAENLISTAKQAINEDLGLVIDGEPQIRIKVIEGILRGSTPASILPANATPKSETDLPGHVFSMEEQPEKEKEDWA